MFLPRPAILLALLLAAHAAAYDCRELYQGVQLPPALFEPSSGKLLSRTPERSTYELGGGKDGQVVRVVPADAAQPTFIEKTYKPQYASQRPRDVEMLAKLGELSARRPTGFRIAQAKLADGLTVHLEDVPGRDLHSLLLDPKIPQALKTRLRETYRHNAKAMATALEAEYGARLHELMNFEDSYREYFRDGMLDGESVHSALLKEGDRDTELRFLLKTDNVVVHFQEDSGAIRMTLVDPH